MSANDLKITDGTGSAVAFDQAGGRNFQQVKLQVGAAGTANDLSTGAGATDNGTPRVTLATDTVDATSIGAKNDATATTDAGNFSLIALVKRLLSKLAVSASGTAAGASEFPVLISGQDGTLKRSLLTDTSGRIVNVGAGAAGAAATGNPLLNAGSDGTNARTLLTDASGRQVVVGAGAAGAAVAGNPVLGAGSDGTNARTFRTDTAGNQQVGIVAPAATVSRIKSAASTNGTQLKAAAAVLYSLQLFNTSTVMRYVKLHQVASGLIVGTSGVAWTIPVPPLGWAVFTWSQGLSWPTGLAYSITANLADNDTTAVAADDIHGMIDWA